MTNMGKFDSIYPLDVYRHVSDVGRTVLDETTRVVNDEISGGTLLPVFTRGIAEAIASTKPEWARFEDTDIAPEVRTDDLDHIAISWACRFGPHVAVQQEIAYDWDGKLFTTASFPTITVWEEWGESLDDAAEARSFARELEAAAALLDRIEEQ